MGRSASRALYLSSVVGLALVSLRPHPVVEAAVDVALMPVRVLAEVVRPARLLRTAEVRAADRRLRALEDEDMATRDQFFADSSAFVIPDRLDLTAGRRFVHAEVIERVAGDLDRIVVQVESGHCQGLEVGMPIISGEVYAGRVHAVDQPRPGLALVDLVTRADFRVGGRLVPDDADAAQDAGGTDPVRLVVGGVSTALRRVGKRETKDVVLAVHNPSRRHAAPGRVVVDEGAAGSEAFRREAAGFTLGTTVYLQATAEDGEPSLEDGIAPHLDYGAGLFQVAIVCPADVVREPEQPLRDVLEDWLWRPVKATAAGDPSTWREGQKLASGRLNGVRTGAAVASGTRLVGRVVHAGFLTSDAALLGDPGMWVPGIARLEGRAQPLVLGRLVSLGRETDAAGTEAILFHWEAIVPLEEFPDGSGLEQAGAETVRAVLYTGSGEPLVPRGLLLGECELPRGPGPHLLRVEEPVDTRLLGRLWVRMPLDELTPTAEAAP